MGPPVLATIFYDLKWEPRASSLQQQDPVFHLKLCKTLDDTLSKGYLKSLRGGWIHWTNYCSEEDIPPYPFSDHHFSKFLLIILEESKRNSKTEAKLKRFKLKEK
eukprot:TRINITY_DN7076_c0_g1_i2.p1 TRINITY_DN7076_c0_g1~~TRINITY_DN7076_c0_g1_i2.p1  ORF type:complete len:113 (-),score=4.87 TRINITY_DN7076_c0_g1_i2:838-1152(-)